MYLKKIILENVGPIERLSIDLKFDSEGKPKPLILVGENGTGKSLVISFIVNALIAAKQVIYENTEVEKGKVYKLRTPLYIKTGNPYYYAKLEFEDDINFVEWQLDRSKKDFEEFYKYCPNINDWSKISDTQTSYLDPPPNKDKIEKTLERKCCLYFPPNRFEDPAWLNERNLLAKAQFRDLQHISGYTERKIISYSPFDELKDWLLDIAFDSRVLELQTYPIGKLNETQLPIPIKVFGGFTGPNSYILTEINNFLNILFDTDSPIRIGIGNKGRRQVSIMIDEKQAVPNLFNMSSGESVLFGLFCKILQDYDLTGNIISSRNDIIGIVIIDEIDIHLHSKYQGEVLPKLIELFPCVQFIVTTHSPLFLLGMERAFGSDGYEIRNMPDCEEITPERFKEFEHAYEFFRNTQRFEKEINQILSIQDQKPILIVEGDSDRIILENAWRKLRISDIPFRIVNGYNRTHIRVVLNDKDFFKKSQKQLFIALFDFDDAYNDWNGLKNFDLLFKDESEGLTKKSRDYRTYACLLPVPPHRSALAGSKFKDSSHLSTELLFFDDVLKKGNNFDEYETPGGGKVMGFKGNKIRFAESTANLDKAEFINFERVFDLFRKIFEDDDTII